jgi:Zn-dependent M28 family amino/carboxypeptidase
VALFGEAAAAVFDELPTGPTRASFSVRLSPPAETGAPQRNVIGLLPGSDPKLADTYVLVTAHYDGQGTRPGPDRVWNSANDNASGTVSVIELASALAATRKHPRRSVVFIAFHGEESGLVGARYYAEHPVIPLEKTIGGINIEMVGRTDDTEGDQRKRASVTGFDYSDVGAVFRRAGEQTGVAVFKHPKNSDAYFGASDNQALAAQGVPVHTVCVTFEYPDYHGAADTWQKIDYENMALTVRMVGTGVLILAQSENEPRWDPGVKGATRYLEAWKKRHQTEKRGPE